MSKTLLLSGDEAVARGAYEAGAMVASAYPGTPSTEILEAIARYPEVYAEWSVNEKVALDLAFGASLAGVRALCSMKHVGVNVASDALMTISYTGVGAGLVLVTADDPGMHSSQNEQDNRNYAKFASVPMLEPSDSAECKEFTKVAYDISERFDTIVMVRLTTRTAHSRGIVELGERQERQRKGVKIEPAKYVMMPAFARPRHPIVLERLKALKRFAEETDLNRIEEGDGSLGIIASGMAYKYAKELVPHASFLKLGLVYPLPIEKIRAFASSVKRLLIIEELDPFHEQELRANGIDAEGKKFFPSVGEFDIDVVEAGLIKAGVLPERHEEGLKTSDISVVPRPPVLCSGCGHRQVFYALKRLNALVFGDIGCYTLGALPPLSSLHTTISMGSSISNAMGYIKAHGPGKNVVAVIGDSTFMHAGIPALLNVVYNDAPLTVLILDNAAVGMTGGQVTPGTGITAQGEKTRAVDLASICRGLGVERVFEVDAYDYWATFKLIKRELNPDRPTVIIARHPCILEYKEALPPYTVISEKCTGCKVCLVIGCPPITLSDTDFTEDGKARAVIDPTTCIGCALCAYVCPEPGCIIPIGG